MGTSDGLWGLVDGMNDAGLGVSLTFGGAASSGDGFGVPLILRYVLQTCARPPTRPATCWPASRRHMAYNVTVLDAGGAVVDRAARARTGRRPADDAAGGDESPGDGSSGPRMRA